MAVVGRVAALLLAVWAGGGARVAGAVDGAPLYRLHCARCHGADGRGDGPDARLLERPPRNLREGFLARYSTDELVRKVRTGEPLVLTLDPVALGRVLENVDALTVHLRRLPAVDWPAVNVGRDLFLQRCEGCHGPTGEGRAKPGKELAAAPPDLGSSDARARLAGDRLLAAVRHALPGMPGLQQVPTEYEARAIASWVALLSPGYRLYTRYCAGCHGENGLIASTAPAAERPKVVFDAPYFLTLQPGELDDAVLHMVLTRPPRMPHLAAEVTQTEARAIVEYLKALP